MATKTLAKLSILNTLRIALEVKVADLWIGAFWATAPAWLQPSEDGSRIIWAGGPSPYLAFIPANGRRYDLWVCLVPCLPLHLTWHKIVKNCR